MTPASPARRRADEFDRLVESLRRGGDAVPAASAELRQLASLATSLHEVRAPQPRTAFTADLRERLMAAAATELTPAAPDAAGEGVRDRLTVSGLSGTAPKQRRQRRLTVAVAALAILGGTAGTALASQNALPGDTLYPVKRAIENIETGLSQGDESKGRTLIADAHTRLSEVDQLSADRRAGNAGEIVSTLTAFTQQAQHGSTLLMQDYRATHDPAAITTLHQFVKQSIDQLTQLSSALPPGARPALTQATQALVSIDQAAEQLCPGCGAVGITQLPSSLLTASGQAWHQLSGAAGTRSGGSTDSAGTATLPGITLPKINVADLPPATVPSAVPSGLPGGVSGSGGATSAAPSPTGTKHHRSSSGSSSSTSPTGAAGTVDDTVKKATSGVGDLVGGVIRGLLGGG